MSILVHLQYIAKRIAQDRGVEKIEMSVPGPPIIYCPKVPVDPSIQRVGSLRTHKQDFYRIMIICISHSMVGVSPMLVSLKTVGVIGLVVAWCISIGQLATFGFVVWPCNFGNAWSDTVSAVNG